MNDKTNNLVNRPYQEIVDDILTSIVGGVVNEPIYFDVKTDLYPLAEPASGIRGITGTRNREHYTFQKEIDFQFSEGDNGVVWQEDSAWPDDETIFYIDYYRKNSRSPLSDINVGSVTRTLGEAISREIATVYQQINLAYLSAFIDTAKGKSLDLVVAILGIYRISKDYARGAVTFFRDVNVKGNITIPQGISLLATKGNVIFKSLEPRTLQRGQVRIDVPVRASEDFRQEAGLVQAGEISEIAQPIAGITRITNFDTTILSADDESDEQLRGRAKAVLRSLGKATLAALARVITEERAELLEIYDPNSPPEKQTKPGIINLLVESEPERFPSLRGSIEGTRAAGILATIIARYIYFKPRLVATLAQGLTAPGKDKIKVEIIAALQKYVDALSSGDAAVGQELLDALKEVQEISDPQFVDILAWRTDVDQPGVESLINDLLQAVSSSPAGDEETLRSAFLTILTEKPPTVSTGRRIPDRSVVQGPSGEQATDEQIESGEFSVVAKLEKEWWVVLDMEPADIVLREERS